MRLLRSASVVPLFVCLAGGVAVAVGAGGEEYTRRGDSFTILPAAKDATHVRRIDLPPGWSVKHRPLKNGSATALFAPGGTFAFEVGRESAMVYEPDGRRWRPYLSLDEFLNEKKRQGAVVERRPDAGGGDVGVVRGMTDDPWLKQWNEASDGTATVTYYSAARDLSLRFVMRSSDAARFEPEAFRFFQQLQTLPSGDPRADDRLLDPAARALKLRFWAAGWWLLGAGAVTFLALLWATLYLEVREASRGLPGLRVVAAPVIPADRIARLELIERGPHGLFGLGFCHAEWFTLNNFEQTHVSAWRHATLPEVAFVLYSPLHRNFRLRFVRHTADTRILVSSTRLGDQAYPPPPGTFIQVRWRGTPADLWAWHLAAEELFPVASPEVAAEAESPINVYAEVSGRFARHHRRGWFWLLSYEPCSELWRQFRLCGVSLRQQIERGWAPDPALTQPRHDTSGG